MIYYVKGNLLESDCAYICHQVNCHGVMASGIARQIREKWPEVFHAYLRMYNKAPSEGRAFWLLGQSQIVSVLDKHIVNMFAQETCGYDGARYTSYDAFSECLYDIRSAIPTNKTIGFPKNIGCGLGGGNWNIVLAMIEEILGKTHQVYIYEYNPKED